MSWQPCGQPTENLSKEPAVEMVVIPAARDLGGFDVRRALPSPHRRSVGPFVFLDQMGPAVFAPGKGIDVRPHPHIGLATVTYLLEGSILHRDNLGNVEQITPGAVNWMTAGRGIVHSERTGLEARASDHPLFGLQMWVALPQHLEETDPAFFHYSADIIPEMEGDGVSARVVAGHFQNSVSPVETASPTFFVDFTLEAGATVVIPTDYVERALYVVEGEIVIDGISHESGQLLVLAPGRKVDVRTRGRAHLMALGGEPLDGPRHLWWNFVSSRPDRIEQAKEDWRRDRFGVSVPEEHEFIPLPS